MRHVGETKMTNNGLVILDDGCRMSMEARYDSRMQSFSQLYFMFVITDE